MRLSRLRVNVHMRVACLEDAIFNVRKLGRVFDLNCCSSELHKQPGERDNPVEPRVDGLLELQVVRCDGPA